MRIKPSQLATILQKCKDQNELRQILRHIFSFKENIDVFSIFLFPDTVCNRIPPFHHELYEALFREGNDAFAAPRGHAKSSITGLIFIIFCIVNKLEKYIVYISQNHTKTVQFLTPIRFEFKNNDRLKWLYGDINMAFGKDEQGKDREDCFDVNDCRVEAVSFEKNLRGFKYRNIRPTLIIGDDIEEDMRVLNPELRVKDYHKLNKVIIPSLDIDGRFKMIGTLIHLDSLLFKKVKQYNGKIYKACDKDFKNLLWPDRFTKAKLEKIKDDIGSIAFQQEYLNNPIDNEHSLIKRDWVVACFDHDLTFKDLEKKYYNTKVLGVDFAFSDRITADRSAFCSVGESNGKYYVFHTETKKGMSVNEQLDLIKNKLHAKYEYMNIGLEENSIKAVSKDIAQMGMPITLFWTGANDPAQLEKAYKKLEFLGKRHTVGKTNMIMRLGTAFENKKFVIPYKTEEDRLIANEILAECTSYALADGKLVEAGVHPDIPIALGYCLEQLNRTQENLLVF
jgi:phage terminase large subunit-like protein